MKKLNIILIISLILLVSCNKEDSNPTGSATEPPSPPTHVLPADNSTDIVTPTTLSWNASSGVIYYVLQVSEVIDFSTLNYDNNIGNVTSKQINLNKGRRYYWRIASANSIGHSDYSSPWSFITGIVPSAPNLVSPRYDTSFYSTAVVLKWDTSNNAVSYSLQVSTDYFSSFVYNDSSLTTTSKEITGLSNSTKYYWRVRANNQHGISNWSSTWRFNNESIPGVPTLLSPTDGASDQDLSIELKWNAAQGTNSYNLQVSSNSSFSNYIYNQSGITATSNTIFGLNDSTTYYWRVSATNSYGTSNYSSVWSFSTYIIEAPVPCPGLSTVTYSGKTYNTIKIKNQCWLKENLDVGTMIQVTQNSTNDGTIEKYCYDNNIANCNTYGGLYQWDEAMQYSITPGTKGICPTGWHIPTRAEFETLRTSAHNEGNSLKAVGQGTGGGQGTNTSGFSALLAGDRYYAYPGTFGSLERLSYFWSSTEVNSDGAGSMTLGYYDSHISLPLFNKDSGFSVRCVKDN